MQYFYANHQEYQQIKTGLKLELFFGYIEQFHYF